MKGKFLKRFLALMMAGAMVIGGIQIPAVTAEAEAYVWNAQKSQSGYNKLALEEGMPEGGETSGARNGVVADTQETENEGEGNQGWYYMAVDGDTETYWHSNFSNINAPELNEDGTIKNNNTITLTLKEAQKVYGVTWLPRQRGATESIGNGLVTKFNVQVQKEGSEAWEDVTLADEELTGDGWTWGISGTNWTSKEAQQEREVLFTEPAENVKKVKYVITKVTGENTAKAFISAAEIAVLGAKDEEPEPEPESPAVTDGLVGYYTFDDEVTGEETLSVFKNTLSKEEEESALLGDANIIRAEESTITQSEDAISGKSVNIKQVSTSASYLTVENAMTNSNTAPYSFSLWLNSDASLSENSDGPSILHEVQAGEGNDSSKQGRAILAYWGSTHSLSTYWNGVTTNYYAGSETDAGNIATGKWYHVVFVSDPTANDGSGQYTFYINGAETGKTTAKPDQTIAASDLRIGAHRFSSNANWSGLLDNLRVYNKAIDADAVSAIFNAERPELTVEAVVAAASAGQGTVSVALKDAAGEPQTSITAKFGEEVTFTAVPEEGYVFKGWYAADVENANEPGAEAVSEESSYTAAIDEAMTLYALFEEVKPVPVESVTVSPDSVTLKVGQRAELTAEVQPAEATNKKVTWETDAENIATVQDGVVTAVAVGEAKITVKSESDPEKTSLCTVTVTDLEDTSDKGMSVKYDDVKGKVGEDGSYTLSENAKKSLSEMGYTKEDAVVFETLVRFNTAELGSSSAVNITYPVFTISDGAQAEAADVISENYVTVTYNPIITETEGRIQHLTTSDPSGSFRFSHPGLHGDLQKWHKLSIVVLNMSEEQEKAGVYYYLDGNGAGSFTPTHTQFQELEKFFKGESSVSKLYFGATPQTWTYTFDGDVKYVNIQKLVGGAAETDSYADINNANVGDYAKQDIEAFLAETEDLAGDDYTEETWRSFETAKNELVSKKSDLDGEETSATDWDLYNALSAAEAARDALKKKEISVASIIVDPSEVTLKVGETQELTATVSPEDADNQELDWSSQEEGIAAVTVAEDGTVTVEAVAEGTAMITATAKDGSGVEGTCKVTVEAAEEPGPGPDADVEANLVGYWTFDDTDTVNGYANTAKGSGIGAAVASGAVTQSTEAVGGKSVSVSNQNNSDSDKSYLTVADSYDPNNSTTIAFWMKPSVSMDSTTNVSVFHDMNGTAGRAIIFYNGAGSEGNSNRIGTYVTGANVYQAGDEGTADVVLTTDQWYHVAVSFDTASAPMTASFYINGELVGIGTLSSISRSTPGAEDLRIGAHRSSDTANFDGLLDNVRIYDTAISADTVKAIYDLERPDWNVTVGSTEDSAEDGGTVKVTGDAYKDGKAAHASTVKFVAEAKDGYIFAGWYSDEAGANRVAQDAEYEMAVNKSVALYAKYIDEGEAVPVTSVTVTPDEVTLTTAGATKQLSAAVAPDNATNKSVTWKSSDEKVATVSASGLVTAVANGTATITATAADGSGKTGSSTITVNISETPAAYTTGVGYVTGSTEEMGTVFVSAESVEEGGSVVYTATPKAGYHFVGWYEAQDGSGDPVSEDESYTLENITENKVLYAKFEKSAIESVKFKTEELTIVIGESEKLEVEVTPADVESKITWKSSDETVAAVDEEGNVTALWPGEATVTATVDGISADLKVIVKGVEVVYNDVPTDQWYYEACNWNYLHKTMTGLNPTTFAPANQIVRAQFAVILYRIAGSPEVEDKETTGFADVDADKNNSWYKAAVIWASENKIITGYTSNGLFGTNDNITREQIATILYRYLNPVHADSAAESEDVLASFPDAGNVQPFAKEAMKWAVENEIIKGDQGLLKPQGNAIRAEAAAIIMRFYGLTEKPEA